MTCPKCNGRGKIQEGLTGELLVDCPACTPCAICAGSRIIDSGGFTPWGEAISLPCPACKSDEWEKLTEIGAAWRKDSSLEKWFPITAEQLRELKVRHCGLYNLVEAYLCTPNSNPAIKDYYDNLVAWFVRNKRPDGSEPLPVSPEQAQ